jgi:hypothetical protein
MCHHTNGQNNPWVEICVDPDVVNSHLAHGDYLGPCDFTKTLSPDVVPNQGLHFNLFPNPASSKVTVEFESGSRVPYIIDLADLTGRKLFSCHGEATMGENNRELNLEGIAPGIYLVTLILDGKKEQKKLVLE